MDESNLIDIWRLMHPNLRRYTYHQQRPTQTFTRLDFFLISQGMTGFIENSSIQPGYCTDHSMITISLNLLNHPRGRGMWKLNNSLLQDIEYIAKIKETVRDTVNINNAIDHQLLWELVKYKIRQETIKFASNKKKKSNRKLKSLEESLQKFEEERDESGIDTEEAKKIREEIDRIQEESTKGAMIRCKVRWYKEGEKSTKYFLNLEKRNYSRKVISRLKGKNNENHTHPEEIRKEIKNYYKELYSSKLQANDHHNEATTFLSKIEKKLTNEEARQLEGPITETEVLEALKTTQNGKSPGSDGLGFEFYKVFWNDIKQKFGDLSRS
jgi:hypothetical protein